MLSSLESTLAELGTSRLRRFVTAMIPIAVAYLVLFGGLAALWGNLALFGGSLAIVVYLVALVGARRALRAGKPTSAALQTGSGLLAMITIGAWFVPFQLPSFIVIAIAAVTVVLPHLDRRALIRFEIAAIAVTLHVLVVDGLLDPMLEQPPRWFQLAILISSSVAASVLTLVMLTADHTRLKALADAATRSAGSATRAQQATEAFLVAAAHQLRTPIATIMMQAEMLADGRKDIDRILRQSARLKHVVDVMLEVTRVTAGTLELAAERFDIARLVDEVAASQRTAAAHVGSTLEVITPETPVVVVGDPRRVEMIVESLIDNAIKHAGGAAIRAEVAVTEDCIAIAVVDHGPGIPLHERAAAFERAERLEARADGGFGVGLWLVRELAHAMRGRADIEGGPGENRLVVRFPRAAP